MLLALLPKQFQNRKQQDREGEQIHGLAETRLELDLLLLRGQAELQYAHSLLGTMFEGRYHKTQFLESSKSDRAYQTVPQCPKSSHPNERQESMCIHRRMATDKLLPKNL